MRRKYALLIKDINIYNQMKTNKLKKNVIAKENFNSMKSK